MVSQIINVIVNSKGAVTVQKQLASIGDSARTTTTYLNSMRAILSAALTFSGAASIIETVDAFTVMQNRLKQVASETNTVSDSWERLLGIADRSFSTIDSTVDLYFRVAQAYKAWGQSAEEAYQFTESFQKAAILSGSTMQTTAQAVYQFGQALNKGKLDGDEFRSVLEGLPYVASLIQKELGVTRAELYELSKDGKISVDRITEAFKRAAGTIEKDWAKVTPTIGMALNVLKNSWTEFIGDIQTSTGVFSLIAYAIIGVANNFEFLAAAIAPVAAALAFVAGRLLLGLVVNGFRDMGTAIRALIPIMTAFNAVLWANPYIIIAAGIVAVIGALVYFRNEIGLTDEVLNAMWSTASNLFSSLVSFLSPVISVIADVVGWFLKWNLLILAIKAIASVTAQDISNGFKSISSAAGSLVAYLKKAFTPVFNDLADLAKNFYSLMMDIVDLFVKALTPGINAVLPVFKSLWAYVEPALTTFIQLLSDIWTGWKNIAAWLASKFAPTVKDVFDGWIVIIRGVIGAINALISALKAALALMSQVGKGGGGGSKGAGMNYGGQFYAGEFANGGGFKVPGTNAGRDTTPVSFRANRGERVTVETKKQQRVNDSGGQAPSVNVPVSVVNVFDPNMIPAAMETVGGQKAFMNNVAANRDQIIAILGVY